MKIKNISKVVLAAHMVFVGMGTAISAEPPSVKAQAATKKHSSFAGGKTDNMPQASQQQMLIPSPLSSDGDLTASRARLARGERFVERTLPEIKTPEIFSAPSERNPSITLPSQ